MVKRYSKKDPHYQRELEKYGHPVPSREHIQAYLKEIGRPVSGKHLIEALVSEEMEVDAFRFRLKAMLRDGQLMSNRRNKFALVDEMSLVRGVVLGHKEGFGFLRPDDGEKDIFLSPLQMRSLYPGDRVLVSKCVGERAGREEGMVVEILERSTTQIVGRFFKENGVMFVDADNKQIAQQLLIPAGEEGRAKHGQFVVAEILTQPTRRHEPTGRIIEILGEHMAPGLETEVVIRSYDLPHTWPEEVLKELPARSAVEIDPADIKGRQDIRHLPLVTIDGEDAKDFDDAVYCETREGGGWRLFVAIADVSHYVTPGSALDKEAFDRGNSVYFPGRVIPMLPEVLSNGLCSLMPTVDRLCMVCEMSIDKAGKVVRQRFYKAVMYSHARLTYTQVAGMLSGKVPKQYKKLFSHLETLHELFQVLSTLRAKRGALDFDTTDTRIVFGESHKIKEVVPVVRNVAHRIIEECMLLANVSAANYLLQHEMSVLYRVHEPPSPEKLLNLRDTLNAFGLRLAGGDDPTSQDYARLLKSIKDRPDARFLQTVILRSMSQAVYTSVNRGHFGLAYEAYGHFTSPIRRYPDLLVHRAITHLLDHKPPQKFPFTTEQMQQFGEHCSMTERRADEATWDVVAWLKCEYMQSKVGQKFSGYVTGVKGFGLFVELDDVYVEGLVHITALPEDYYEYDAVRHCLKGRRSGRKYGLGDRVRILVARVDVDQREMDFDIVSDA